MLCVFFTYFDDADYMLIHVILIVGSCYTHTATQHAHYINIFFLCTIIVVCFAFWCCIGVKE
jgi:hypothetical protein